MDISSTRIAVQSPNSSNVKMRSQDPQTVPSPAVNSADITDTVSISSEGNKALAASNGAALRKATHQTSAEKTANSDEELTPLEKQIKNIEEQIEELKEQLNELKGDNSDEAIEKRQQIQQQIVILDGMVATLSKNLSEQTATAPQG
ncbi:hypothetical protein ACWXWU_05955 [Shewanella sp. A14]